MVTTGLSNALARLKKLLKSGASTTDAVNKINQAVRASASPNSRRLVDIVTGHEMCSHQVQAQDMMVEGGNINV